MTLAEGKKEKTYQVVDTNADDNLKHRLFALGIIRGTPLTVINRKGKNGAMVIKVRGSRFALGYDIAQKIEVDDVL